MSRFKLLSGFLGLLVMAGLAVAAVWLAGGLPQGVFRSLALSPDTTVRVTMHTFTPLPPANSRPFVRIGNLKIEQHGEPVDGIVYDDEGLLIPAAQFARLEGQPVTDHRGAVHVWIYGPLDSSRITRDESGQYVLHLEEDLLLTFQLRRDDLLAVRAVVTDTQAVALLDQAVQQLDVVVDPEAWRDHVRLQPARGAQVFAAMQSAGASLQMIADDQRLYESLGEKGLVVGRTQCALVQMAHNTARAAVSEARTAGAPEELISRALDEDWEGQQDEWQSHMDEALQHYITEWQIAMQALAQATPQASAQPPGGTPRATPAP